MKIIEELKSKILLYHFVFDNEKSLQEQLASVFSEAGIPFLREFPLTPKDRPDFAISDTYPGLVAVEVKIDGAPNAHLRQLKRYANHPRVQAVVLIKPRPTPMPETLSGKPCHLISLWKQLL